MSFARFGIDHLSPSSLNCWQASPGVWALKYLGKMKDDNSPAASRGNAVERGIEKIIRGSTLVDAQGFATSEFVKLTAGENNEEIRTEAALIAGMVKQGGSWWADMALARACDLAATQLRVETWLNGVSIPVIGYVDFTFMDGPDVDLKTTKACPSKPKPDHLRQIALYAQARGRPAALLYVTEKRSAFYCPHQDELDVALADLTEAAQSLERFLNVMPDAETAMRCLPMDRDNFRWSQAAQTVVTQLQGAF